MQKRVTMQAVADRIGVSKVTVSKALRGSKDISDAMRDKIVNAASELGYIYNVTGRMLRDNLTYSIGVITSERFFGKGDYFYVDLYKLLSNYIENIDYTAMFHILDLKSEKELALPGMISNQKVDGVIILGQLSKEYIQEIIKLDVPMVFLDFYYDRFDVDSVISDNFFGAYEITNTLIENGHRDIAFVGNLNLTSSIQDRYLGFYKSLLEYKLKFQDNWLINDRTDESEWIDIKLPENMPTAFVCNCDKTAQILVEKLKKEGYKVPEDCSVVGFDDSVHAVQTIPSISTVRVDLDEMARVTVSIMSKKIKNEGKKYGRVLVKGKVIHRDSIKSI